MSGERAVKRKMRKGWEGKETLGERDVKRKNAKRWMPRDSVGRK